MSTLLQPPGIFPCPFDGAPAKLDKRDGSYGYTSDLYSITCTKCAARSPEYSDERWKAGRGTYYETEEAIKSAVDWWNRRAPAERNPT